MKDDMVRAQLCRIKIDDAKPGIRIQMRWHSFKNVVVRQALRLMSSLLFFFQVMKPTRTSSETFHKWPQTTQRSSNAAAQTPKINQMLPPPTHTRILSNTHIENMQVSNTPGMQTHTLSLATCHMFSHSSAGVDFRGGMNAPNSEFFVRTRQTRTIVPKWEHWNGFMRPA